MNPIDYWRFSGELNVIQASLLILGLDPADYQSHIERLSPNEKPGGYVALSTALKNAITSERLTAQKYYEESFGGNSVSWEATVFDVDDLKVWLREKGLTDGFFVQEQSASLDFLDLDNEFYPPKLAAAFHAWTAVTTDQDRLSGKTPKQALEKWLREHASSYALTKDDGSPNESAIEEISKVANWNMTGGVAKTVTRVQRNPPTPSSPELAN